MLRHWRHVLLSAAICLTLAACGDDQAPGEVVPTPTLVTLPRALIQTSPPQPADTDSSKAAPTVLSEPSPEASAAVETPLASLSGLDVGLEALDSYRTVATVSFAGATEGGENEQWQAAFLEETARSSGVRHLRISTTEVGDASTEFYVVGDTLYQLDGDNQNRTCHALSGDMVAQSLSLTRPAAFLFGLEVESLAGMTLVRRAENVDGVAADRYRIDRSLALPGVGDVTVQSDVWVAQPAGYVARFQGLWSGVAGNMMDAQSRGVLTMEYRIEAVNALPAIELPVECSNIELQTDVPLPNNAQNEVIMADMVMFTSPDAPETVASFYRDALPAAGWSLVGEQPAGDALLLDFTRGEEHVTVTISPQENGASVMVMNR